MKSNKFPKEVEENLAELSEFYKNLEKGKSHQESKWEHHIPDKKLKALWYSIISLALATMFGSGVVFVSKDLRELSIYGNTTIGTVVDYRYEQRRRRWVEMMKDFGGLFFWCLLLGALVWFMWLDDSKF
jgi:hypothetical protein